MKTSNCQRHVSLVCVLIILLIGACKKELANDSTNIKKPDLLLSNEGVSSKIRWVLRQSPGLKVEVKGKTIPRVFPKLQGADKMTAILKEESKKKKPEAITISNATFKTIDMGSYYDCLAEVYHSGPNDWYIINTNTGV